MKRFWKIAPWLTRLVLAPPAIIFGLIAARYVVHPAAAATVGISLTTPLSATILRIGFGAFPLGCSIFTVWCLISSRRILTGLGFVSIMLGVALAVRIFGVVVDGTLRESVGLIGAEVVLLLLSLTGLVIESRRQKPREYSPS